MHARAVSVFSEREKHWFTDLRTLNFETIYLNYLFQFTSSETKLKL